MPADQCSSQDIEILLSAALVPVEFLAMPELPAFACLPSSVALLSEVTQRWPAPVLMSVLVTCAPHSLTGAEMPACAGLCARSMLQGWRSCFGSCQALATAGWQAGIADEDGKNGRACQSFTTSARQPVPMS